jgi:quinol monooxygenase YgiN
VIYLNVLLTVKQAADIDKVRSGLATLAAASRAEPGCERFEVYHSQAERRQFMLVERWADQAALDAHRLADAFAQHYVPNVLPLLERAPHPSDLVA